MQLPDTQSKYADFATEVRNTLTHSPDHDHAWVPFPNQKHLTYGTRRVYRARINRGELLGPGFQARIHAGHLYVRVRP